jgi:hypothetical protein
VGEEKGERERERDEYLEIPRWHFYLFINKYI